TIRSSAAVVRNSPDVPTDCDGLLSPVCSKVKKFVPVSQLNTSSTRTPPMPKWATPNPPERPRMSSTLLRSPGSHRMRWDGARRRPAAPEDEPRQSTYTAAFAPGDLDDRCSCALDLLAAVAGSARWKSDRATRHLDRSGPDQRAALEKHRARIDRRTH